jgi:hypothetical protein
MFGQSVQVAGLCSLVSLVASSVPALQGGRKGSGTFGSMDSSRRVCMYSLADQWIDGTAATKWYVKSVM